MSLIGVAAVAIIILLVALALVKTPTGAPRISWQTAIIGIVATVLLYVLLVAVLARGVHL